MVNFNGATNIINSVCNIIRPINYAVDTIVDVAQIITDENIKGLKVAAVISRTAYTALNIISLICQHKGLSNKTTAILKFSELGVRLADVPINFMHTARKIGIRNIKAKSPQAILRLIEKGGIAPLAGVLRTISEINIVKEKIYIEKLEKDPESQRPVWEFDEDGIARIKEFKVINKEESKEFIKLCERINAGLNVTETLSQAGILEGTYRSIIYKVLSGILRRDQRRIERENQELNALIENQVNENNALNQIENLMIPDDGLDLVMMENIDGFQEIDGEEILNLKRATSIPDIFYKDIIFSKYICPISLQPIRYVVQDPTANGAPIYYERDKIASWLVNHNTSPMTRLELKEEDLVPRPDIQSIIDQRLDFYSEKTREFIVRSIAQQSEQEEV